MMLTIGLSYIGFIMLRYIPFPSFIRTFIKKGCWILSTAFSVDARFCEYYVVKYSLYLYAQPLNILELYFELQLLVNSFILLNLALKLC
jgi:hypothetical protein